MLIRPATMEDIAGYELLDKPLDARGEKQCFNLD